MNNNQSFNATRTFISGNKAKDGGGVWLWQYDGVDFNMNNGVAVVGNTATDNGDDFYSKIKEDTHKNIEVNVTDDMLGGGSIKWFQDLAGARYIDGNREDAVLGDQAADQNIAMHSGASEADIQKAKKIARLFIIDNEAAQGGGIGNNDLSALVQNLL